MGNMAGRGTDITLGGNIEYLLNAKLKKLVNLLFRDKEFFISKKFDTENNDTLIHPFLELFSTFEPDWFLDQKNLPYLLDFINEEDVPDDPKFHLLKELRNKILIEQGTNQKEKRDKVLKLGGLHVIGTERHESRRIDNQLRGRSGRQGDQGSSRFFLSLDDKLVRLFGGDKILDFIQN